MAESVVEDPVFRYKVRFSRPSDEVLRGEFWVAPGGGGLIEHMHPRVEERFTIVDGEITARANRRKRRARAGESFTIPSGVAHCFKNTGESQAYVVVDMEPAGQMEQFFHEAAALAQAGMWISVGRRGIPKGPRALLELAAFLDRWQELFIPTSPPRAVQRIGVPPLARLARWRKSRHPSAARSSEPKRGR